MVSDASRRARRPRRVSSTASAHPMTLAAARWNRTMPACDDVVQMGSGFGAIVNPTRKSVPGGAHAAKTLILATRCGLLRWVR